MAADGEDVGMKTPPPLPPGDGDRRGDVETAAVPCPAEDPGKLKCSVIFLCFYGFMASIRPGESFITPNLLSSEKNFTREQVTNEITPVLTYSYMAVLVPAFLLTDLLRYKPVLIVQAVSLVAIWVLMLLGTTLLHMQLMEFFYGVTMACRVAYSSYIFSLVTPALYQRVAGYSRSAVLLGVFVSSVLGQLCLSLGDISFHTLDAISLGFVSFGLALACCLPWPRRSLFFNRTKRQEPAEKAVPTETDEMNPPRAVPSSTARWKESVFVQMLLEVGNMAKRPNLRLWSLWWIFNSTGYYLVLFYVHILWNKVLSTSNYNGAVEAVATLLSAITSFLAGFAKLRWNVWSELVIGGITALQAVMLLVMGTTGNIWVCYCCYILFRGFYQFLVPIATFQIASSLTRELCALVFGINTFLGTVLKSIINLIFSDKKGLGLDVTSQFHIYFIYFTLLTVAYVISAGVVLVRHYRTRNRNRREEGPSPDRLHTELTPVSVTSEAELLSNSQSVKA